MKWIFIDVVIIDIEVPTSFNILCDTTVTIYGTATPDVPTIWTQVSGNTVTILDPTSKTTDIIRGSLSGPFVFKLSTLDGRFYKYTTVYTTPTSELPLGGSAAGSNLGILTPTFIAPSSEGSFDLLGTPSTVSIGWQSTTNNFNYASVYYFYKYDRNIPTLEGTTSTNRYPNLELGKTYKVTTKYVSPFKTYYQDSPPFSIALSNDRYTTSVTKSGGYSQVPSTFNRLEYGVIRRDALDPHYSGGYSSPPTSYERLPYTAFNINAQDYTFSGGYKMGTSLTRTSYNGTILG